MTGIKAVDFSLNSEQGVLLDKVNLELASGQTHAIVGPRGAGKTVFLRSLVGLWPEGFVSNGLLEVQGIQLSELDSDERLEARRRELLFLPASGLDSLSPVETVAQHFLDIGSVLRLGESSRSKRRQKILEMAVQALKSLGMADPERVLVSLPDELSGGMRKRVLLALALVLRPGLLAADDPTNGLDVTIQRQLLDLLSSLQDQESFTLVIATQDLGVVAHYCDTVTVFSDGQVLEHSTPEIFFGEPVSQVGKEMLARAAV